MVREEKARKCYKLFRLEYMRRGELVQVPGRGWGGGWSKALWAVLQSGHGQGEQRSGDWGGEGTGCWQGNQFRNDYK